MERDRGTALLDGPSDEEVSDFLDEAMGTAEDDDEPESKPATKESFFGDEEASADPEDEDDSPEPSAEELEDDEEEPDARELQRQLAELHAEREAEREQIAQRAAVLEAQQRQMQTARTLMELRSRLTDQEWDVWTHQLVEGFKQHRATLLEQRLAAYEQRDADAAFEAAETVAMNDVLDQVHAELEHEFRTGLTPLEERLLRTSQDVASFHENLKTLITERRTSRERHAEATKRGIREARRARGADRTGVKSSGGARPASKTYGNFNPDRFDDYLDDVMGA